MRNKWYADNRDLVKWSALIQLAKMNSTERILQIAYFRDDDFYSVEIDGEEFDIPLEVKTYLRDIRRIEEFSSLVKVSVFNVVLKNRIQYMEEAKKFIFSFSHERCIVFLDPDTGLEPANPNLNHVLDRETTEFWATLKPGDVLALYQHKTNRNDEPWVEPKRIQFERAIKAAEGTVKVASGLKLARDVVLFYAYKA